jgi:ribosome recycling factor
VVSEQIDRILLESEEKMEKAIAVAREDFVAIRTGRANAAMFSKVMVDYYGTPTPVNQLAQFQIPEARSVLITPYDKGSFAAIEKALRDSDLGVNPTNDGVVIRVNLPTLTEERRKEYIKVAKHKAEDARVSIRNVRRHAKDALDRLAKDGEVGEDDVRRAEKHLDDATHKAVEHIDEILKHKEAELLEV